MTGNDLILDTNVAIDYFKGKSHVTSVIQKQTNLYMPSIVLGELYVGAHRSHDYAAKMKEIKELRANCILLHVTHAVIAQYALIKTALLNKGKPISENDIWIAAIAIQKDVPLYTYDKHFKEVDGLQLFNPLTSI